VEGFVKLRRDLNARGDFVLSPEQQGRIDKLLSESDSLRRFVEARLRRWDGKDVSSAELISAYAEYCGDQGWSPMPVPTIEAQLPSLILEKHHVSKTHSVKRDGKSVRGYHNISFIEE
jgi:putative DNA primase/helicase